MSGGWEEVDAAVDSAVRYPLLAVDVQLLSQVFLILLGDVLHYGLPAEKRSGREESVSDWNIPFPSYHLQLRRKGQTNKGMPFQCVAAGT